MGKVRIRDEAVKVKYAKELQEKLDEWESKSPEVMIAFEKMFQRGVHRFILMWNIIKRIEKEFNINVSGIVRDEIWKNSYQAGQKLAENYKTHGLKDLYDGFLGFFELFCKYEWFEFNDKVLELRCHACPNLRHFKEAGWTSEQIKEVAPYFCLADIGVMTGFNPRNDVFPQARLILNGDQYCSYRVESTDTKAIETTEPIETTEATKPAEAIETSETAQEKGIKSINF